MFYFSYLSLLPPLPQLALEARSFPLLFPQIEILSLFSHEVEKSLPSFNVKGITQTQILKCYYNDYFVPQNLLLLLVLKLTANLLA